MKGLFQELCTEGVDWDDELNGSILKKWNAILRELDDLESMRIPRCYSIHKIQHRLRSSCMDSATPRKRQLQHLFIGERCMKTDTLK